MHRHLISSLTALALCSTACGTAELSPEELGEEAGPGRTSDSLFTANVRVGDSSSLFIADEMAASVASAPRGRELVIYAASTVQNETLAFVLDLSSASLPGALDLSQHGVIYMEPGMGSAGADLTFDGQPLGYLELEGLPTPGATISGRFNFLLPGGDESRVAEEQFVQLDGSFVLQVAAHQP